jgi:hypothetical protein
MVASLSLISLALGGLMVPLTHVRAAELSLDKVQRLDSLMHVALAKGQHVANDLATLYRIRELASAPARPASPPPPASVDSPKPPVEVCSSVFRGPARQSSH